MYPGRIINKVPGELPVTSKTEHLKNLSSLSIIELQEIIQRQEALLAKRAFISNLPDKGEKIYKLKLQLEAELQKRSNDDEICSALSELTLLGKEANDMLEWRREVGPAIDKLPENEVHDIDDESDPFKILVSHSSAEHNKKKYRFIQDPGPLIQPMDVKSLQNGISDCSIDLFAASMCKKMDGIKVKKERFLPHKTLTHDKVHTDNGSNRRKTWDVSAATFPRFIHDNVKLVSLEESILLQMDQAKQLRDIQIRHAVEKLKDKRFPIGDSIPSGENVLSYREVKSNDIEESSESGNESDT